MEQEKYKPSELLIDIFKMFNVIDQRDRMKLLSKKDLYYLLLCCIDKHDEEQSTVISNFKDFELEIDEITSLQKSQETTNPFLLELLEETDSTWIEVVDNLPNPYTVDEIRELKLNNLLDN